MSDPFYNPASVSAGAPSYTGGSDAAELARLRAELAEKEARLNQVEADNQNAANWPPRPFPIQLIKWRLEWFEQANLGPKVLLLAKTMPYWVLGRSLFYVYYFVNSLVATLTGSIWLKGIISSIILAVVTLIVGCFMMVCCRRALLNHSQAFLTVLLAFLAIYGISDLVGLCGVGVSEVEFLVTEKTSFVCRIFAGIGTFLQVVITLLTFSYGVLFYLRWKNGGGVASTKQSMLEEGQAAAADPRVRKAAVNGARQAAQNPEIRQAAFNAAVNNADAFI